MHCGPRRSVGEPLATQPIHYWLSRLVQAREPRKDSRTRIGMLRIGQICDRRRCRSTRWEEYAGNGFVGDRLIGLELDLGRPPTAERVVGKAWRWVPLLRSERRHGARHDRVDYQQHDNHQQRTPAGNRHARSHGIQQHQAHGKTTGQQHDHSEEHELQRPIVRTRAREPLVRERHSDGVSHECNNRQHANHIG